MAKHPYDLHCDCSRCERERARRAAQSASNPTFVRPAPRRRQQREPRPAPGSLAWAEARGGLIGGYEED